MIVSLKGHGQYLKADCEAILPGASANARSCSDTARRSLLGCRYIQYRNATREAQAFFDAAATAVLDGAQRRADGFLRILWRLRSPFAKRDPAASRCPESSSVTAERTAPRSRTRSTGSSARASARAAFSSTWRT